MKQPTTPSLHAVGAPSKGAPRPQPAAPLLAAEHVAKAYPDASGRPLPVLGDVSFSVAAGEFVSVVGPSGCGKSTLIQILTGLMPPGSGQVSLSGRPVTEPPAEMVLVFQQYSKSLLPWRTVMGNMLFGMENLSELSKSDREERARRYLREVGLSGFERLYPSQLSGGMQQRLAMARALARDPQILIMDEPFSSVDAFTRQELQDLVLRIWQEHGTTVLFVTHDIEEAVYLSTRVLALSGRPTQVLEDLPVDLPYPRNQLTTREHPRFLHLRHHVYELVGAAGRQSAAAMTNKG